MLGVEDEATRDRLLVKDCRKESRRDKATSAPCLLMEIAAMVVCASPLRVISIWLLTRSGCLDGVYAARGRSKVVKPFDEVGTPLVTCRGVGRTTEDVVVVREELLDLPAGDRVRDLVGDDAWDAWA